MNDSWRGWWIREGRGLSLQFELPDPPFVYAQNPPGDWVAYVPTALPAGRPCIEVTGAHYKDHDNDHAPFNDGFGVWDWCNNIGWTHWENTTATGFRDAYVRSFVDEYGYQRKMYYVEAIAENPAAAPGDYDCWDANIYNFNVGNWEMKARVCGTEGDQPGTDEGWVMHETKHLAGTDSTGLCYDMRTAAAGNVHVMLSAYGSVYWQDVSGTDPVTGAPLKDEMENGEQKCWTSGLWQFSEGLAGAPNSWRGLTPTLAW